MTDVLRAAVRQMRHRDTVDENLAAARSQLDEAQRAGAQLALLPEYWFATFREPVEPAPLHAFLAAESRARGMAIAANVIDGAHNVGVVYEGGRLVLEQVKIHPMPREAAMGIVGGDGLATGTVAQRPTGLLVCADVLYPEAVRVLALQGAEVLLNPVMSPFREVDNTKLARDAIFIARAYDSGAFLLKAGGYRHGDGERPGVAGRSLIAAPWGLLAHYRDDFEEEVLVADLDFERLHDFRKHQATFPARRPEAYRGLLD